MFPETLNDVTYRDLSQSLAPRMIPRYVLDIDTGPGGNIALDSVLI